MGFNTIASHACKQCLEYGNSCEACSPSQCQICHRKLRGWDSSQWTYNSGWTKTPYCKECKEKAVANQD